jgi:hypothetical protein
MTGSDPEQPPPTHQPYGQNPYGAPPPPYQQPYQQPPYGQPRQPSAPPPYGQYSFAPQAPAHPSSTTALVLSLVGLGGILLCGGVTLVLSPFAWVIGGRAVKEIDANPGAYTGREAANAGRIMGIVGTVLLVLGLLAVIAFLGLIVGASSEATTFDSGTGGY